jgi:hypothetical protein
MAWARKAAAPLLSNFQTAQAMTNGKNTTDANINHRLSGLLAVSFRYLLTSEACMIGFQGISK